MPMSPIESVSVPTADSEARDPRHAAMIRSRIAEGVASARAGRLVDGDGVFARIRAELNERERPRRD